MKIKTIKTRNVRPYINYSYLSNLVNNAHKDDAVIIERRINNIKDSENDINIEQTEIINEQIIAFLDSIIKNMDYF